MCTPRLTLITVSLLLVMGCDRQDPAPSNDSQTRDDGQPVADKNVKSPDRALKDAPAPKEAAIPDQKGSKADAPPASLKVLFVGNSYTQFNDLPKLVAKLAAASGKAPKITVDSVLAGGATLQQHFTTTGALAKLQKGSFSHAVFQGQSLEALFNPTNFGVYAKKLADEAKKNKIMPVWFETWARAKGNEMYKYAWSGGTPAAMQKGLRLAYGSVAKATGGLYAPVGDAWMAVLKAHPTIKLHDNDGSHPSIQGSYLAACVFYGVLAGRAAEGIGGVPGGVTKGDAAKLAKVAWTTVKAGAP